MSSSLFSALRKLDLIAARHEIGWRETLRSVRALRPEEARALLNDRVCLCSALRDLLDTMARGDEYKAYERMTAAREALDGRN